jgi:hypothetical protein
VYIPISYGPYHTVLYVTTVLRYGSVLECYVLV